RSTRFSRAIDGVAVAAARRGKAQLELIGADSGTGNPRFSRGMSVQRAGFPIVLGRPEFAERLLRTVRAFENRSRPRLHPDRQRLVVLSHVQSAVCDDVAGIISGVGRFGLAVLAA